MRKVSKKLHLWLSLPLGLVISLICLSGAVLAFEQELTELVYRPRYYVEPLPTPRLPLDQLALTVARSLPDTVTVTGITVPLDSTRSYTVLLSAPRGAGVLVDPYRGTILGRSDRTPFFATVRRLHRWLLWSKPTEGDGPSWGRIIVGTSVLLFVLSLLTGLLAWWPKQLKGLGKRLKIHTDKGRPRLMHELHTVGGGYALVLLLVMSLTGLTWSFEWYKSGFYAVLGVELPKEQHGGKPEGAKGAHGKGARGRAAKDDKSQGVGPSRQALPPSSVYWPQLYAAVRQVKPYPEITLRKDEVSARCSTVGNVRAADVYSFDPETGALGACKRYDEAAPAGRLRGWIYSLHTGAWGGWLTKLLYCLAALLGGTLPLTGYYLFARRRWGKGANKRSVRS